MARYGKKASEKVADNLHGKKAGKLHSGKSGTLLRSRAQAFAIGLGHARSSGAKVPRIPRKRPGPRPSPRPA